MDKEKNRQDREWMIKYWAKFVRESDDKEWSRQQKEFIDSIL